MTRSSWVRMAGWAFAMAGITAACGGVVESGEASAAGSGGVAGTGGVAGSGGLAGSGGGVAGTSGVAGIDGGIADAGSDTGKECFDLASCAPDEWCDLEPAAPGMCSSGGKAGVCRPRPNFSDCPDYDHCPGACGCDGSWFCSPCEAHASGIPVTADNTWCVSDPGKTCGGHTDAKCGPEEWCDYPPGAMCGAFDMPGVCRPRPDGCDDDCPGVCGCDGVFHCNECQAHASGFDITSETYCMDGGDEGTVCGTDVDCKAGLKCCYPCGVPGCENVCTTPGTNGECPMYP
jgi:hypothetical protein